MPKSTANKMEKMCPAIFGIVALVLLCTGAFSPGWLVIDLAEFQGYSGSSLTVHMGLYYAVFSGNGIRVTVTYGEAPELESYITTHLLEYQIETIIGFVLCFISIIITFAYNKTGSIGVLIAPIILYMLADNQQLKKRNKWMFKLHVLTNELLDWASRVYSMYSKGQAHKPEYLEQIFIQLNADMIGHLRKKLEAEGYSVWNAITYRHHQQFVDDLAFNNRKMKEDIAFREQESDAKQTQINNLLTQLKEEQRLRVREVSQTKGELESQVEALKDDVARLKKEKDGLLNRYIIETNTTQRYSNKVEKLENEVEELGSNLEVVMNRYPPVSSRSREAVTREMLLETRIARLQKENDTLLNRLTEAETKNIRQGFPELEPYVDMKEEQGPLFPQRLNSLYVDDWTNAYEVVKNVYGERKSIVVLLEWLETCQKMGRDLFDEQKEMLKCETVGFLRKYQKNERKDLALPVSKNGVIHIKDFQRKMAADTIPAFKEVCRLNTIKSIRFKGRNAALDYINKCAELCWMMNFEDPPVGMDFEFKEGGKINPNRFTTYFKKGKLIDYLVWPVLMSLSDNTLLTKGIVQSK